MKTILSEKLPRILKNKKRLEERLNIKITNRGKEAEQKIKIIAKDADYTINNNGNFDELYKQIDEIVKKYNK